MDEELRKQGTDTAMANSGAKSYDNTVSIDRLYDAQRQAKAAELEAAYNQGRSNIEASREQIAPTYQAQRNAAAVDWERQRRNFLEGAARSGINTGAGSQAQLAMMGQQQRAQTALGTAQANAEAAAERQLADLYNTYQTNLGAANAGIEAQRTAAQIAERSKQYDRDLAQAQALAQYGDFSGYGRVYGDDAARRMSDMWAMQNPDAAYITGHITQGQRDNIKAGRPINQGLDSSGQPVVPVGGGYSDPWAYGGSGWNGSGSTPSESPEPTDTARIAQAAIDAARQGGASVYQGESGIRGVLDRAVDSGEISQHQADVAAQAALEYLRWGGRS
ncbi:MAG: hypothetical protein IKR93_05270 [Firmicutes bacterium]|nr:hypothetical protein [Bacillota bacterium]